MQFHKKKKGFFLDTGGRRCYHKSVKSVEREKYRPKRTAQRAWQMLQAGTMPGQGRTPASCKRNPPLRGSMGAAGRALQRQRFKGERIRKVTVCLGWRAVI